MPELRKIFFRVVKWLVIILLIDGVLFWGIISLPDPTPIPQTGVNDYALTKAVVMAMVKRMKEEGCGGVVNLSGDGTAFCEKVRAMNGDVDDRYDDVDSDCAHEQFCTVYYRFDDGVYASCMYMMKEGTVSIRILPGNP